ncbi:hypothetical protein JHK85_010452 [Glycine max]|nr:hypothetical protein JHK85_010452 [Glycine max]KAG5066451.1 hypothetical protein JHK86_010182 [Glycine max]
MLASDSGSVLRPKPPVPTLDPTRSLLRPFCFDPGSRPARPSLSLKMELLRRMSRGCFKTEVDSAGQDFFDAAAAAAPNPAPHHLVIMVNGIIGSAADWRYAAEQFVKKLPDKVIVHRSECNSSKLTFDGVDTMGERLAEEVLSVVKRWPEVQKISFVAHSLGGLVARYAIGRLYDYSSTLALVGTSRDYFNEEKTEFSKQFLEQSYEAKIAGLEPMNFITFATPHLGSRGNKQLPFLCGLPFLERRASETAHLVAGRSGKHLFLMDNDDGKRPLLLRMVNDSDDLKFMSALRAFKRRVAYANANYDQEMIRGLTQVSWERVDVSFQKSKQRYVAHSTIQVKTYWLNSDGADVVYHMIDNFLL